MQPLANNQMLLFVLVVLAVTLSNMLPMNKPAFVVSIGKLEQNKRENEKEIQKKRQNLMV